MTLAGAACHQLELHLIQNCVPWVSVEKSLLYNIVSACQIFFPVTPRFSVAGNASANTIDIVTRKLICIRNETRSMQDFHFVGKTMGHEERGNKTSLLPLAD